MRLASEQMIWEFRSTKKEGGRIEEYKLLDGATLKVRLSSKRHLPIFCLEGSRILDREWYPYQLSSMMKTFLEARKWRVGADGLRLENEKLNLIFTTEHATNVCE